MVLDLPDQHGSTSILALAPEIVCVVKDGSGHDDIKEEAVFRDAWIWSPC